MFVSLKRVIRFVAFGLSFAPAVAGANTLGKIPVGPPDVSMGITAAGGIVTSDGTVNVGTKFKASRTGVGRYTVVFPNHTLAGCPATAVSGFGAPGTATTGVVLGEGCSAGGATFNIGIYALGSSLTLVDSAFEFATVVAKYRVDATDRSDG